MIPLDAGQTVKYTDPKSGIVFEFCYLLGCKQEEYISLMYTLNKNIRETNAIVKKTKTMNVDEVESDIEYAREIERLEIELSLYRKRLINLFLVKINGQDIDGIPSEKLCPGDIIEMTHIIQEKLPELSGRVGDELKNSSRLHSSVSSQTGNSINATNAQRKAKKGVDA